MNKKSIWMIVAAICVSACGGGGGGGSAPPPVSPPPPPPPPSSVLSGQFKDANVNGLSYSTPSRSGITDAMGTFSYEAGEMVEFSVGGVVIGSAAGSAVTTPIDLVAGGSSDSTEVRNIVRFLMMLDQNEDPSDGITISQAVRDVAASWTQVDFTTGDLGNELATIVSDVASVDSRVAPLPGNQAATDHVEGTMHCLMSGYFLGAFAEAESSTIKLLIDPATGLVIVTYPGAPAEFISAEAVSVDGMRGFVASAMDGSGDNFEGRLDDFDTISGVWTFGNDSGEFTAIRRLADPSAIYRFTGRWWRDTVRPRMDGPLVLNVDAQGNLTGESTENATGNEYTATGTFDGQDFDYDWSTSGGTGAGNRTGTVNADLFVEGNGTNNSGASRPWVAQGCKLN